MPVERDNPGVDVGEQDFHGAAPRFEFLMALLQFRSHTVKGRNQGPDFVFPLSLDAVGPVALGDLPRAGGELLEGHGDFFGQEETEPDCRERRHQGSERHRDDVVALEWLLENLQVTILA